jgi:hypothetical protein
MLLFRQLFQGGTLCDLHSIHLTNVYEMNSWNAPALTSLQQHMYHASEIILQ